MSDQIPKLPTFADYEPSEAYRLQERIAELERQLAEAQARIKYNDDEWRRIAADHDKYFDKLKAEIARMKQTLVNLCDEIEATEEHGGLAHEDGCPICEVIAAARANLEYEQSAPKV